MDKSEFKAMWERMQKDGYFEQHAHYQEVDSSLVRHVDDEMDRTLASLDYSSDDLKLPFPYSVELERSIKRTEPIWLKKLFAIPASGLAIDVGCGYGRTIRWLCNSFDHVIGFDVSASAIEKARENFAMHDNVELLVSDADGFPPEIGPNSADFVYAFTVFQHIPREFTARYVRDAADRLKAGGLFVFNLISEINEELDTGDVGVEWAIGYSRDSARALVESSGLAVERVARWRADGAPASWIWVAARK